MKNFLLPLCLVALTLFSCDKDDDCTPGFLESHIVGTWQLECNILETCEVQFLENGTFIDDSEALVFNPNGDVMTYTVVSDDQIRITVPSIGPAQYHINVVDYTCDVLDLEFASIEYHLVRK